AGAVADQSGFRQRHRGTRGRIRRRSARYRLQLALSARYRRADRRRGGAIEARRSRLADADPGQGRQGRALRADADAGVALRVYAITSPSYPLPLWERVARAVRPEPGEGSVPAGFHHRPVAKRSRSHARQLRRDATDAETAMWRLLRHRRLAGLKVRRQVPFHNFILDFVCFDRKTVIEID